MRKLIAITTALLARLPWSVRLTRYEVDFCGVTGAGDFTLHRDEVRRGWKNGDICFTADGTYFSVLFIEHNVVRVRKLLIDFGGIHVKAGGAEVVYEAADSLTLYAEFFSGKHVLVLVKHLFIENRDDFVLALKRE